MVNGPLWYTTFQQANTPGTPYASVATRPPEGAQPRPAPSAIPPGPSPYLRSLAQTMMAQGSSTAPVASPLAGLARALTGAAGGYFAGQVNRQQEARDTARADRLAGILGIEDAAGLGPDEMLAVASLRGKQGQKPLSTLGKLRQDFEAGLLTPVQYEDAVKKATTSGPLVSVNTGEEYDETAAKERAKSDQAYRSELREGANAARQKITSLNRLEDLIESGQFETGRLQPFKRWAGSLISALGRDPEQYGLGDVASAEEGRALTNRLVMDSLQAFPGALSEKELDFATASSASESLSPEANLALIRLAKTAAERQREQYAMLRKWNREFGSPGATNEKGQDFEDMWDAWVQEQGADFEAPETVEASGGAVQAGMVPSVSVEDVKKMKRSDLPNLDMNTLSDEALDAVIERLGGG